jgi:hypothetical protein
LKELKKRMLDHLNSAGFDISLDDIRLWLYNEESHQENDYLETVCQNVSKNVKILKEEGHYNAPMQA